MASKAIWEMSGTKFEIDSYSVSFSRNLEPTGRTTGQVHGGEIQLSISTDSSDSAKILQEMLKEANQKGTDSKITFYEAGDSTKELKNVEIKGGFIYAYSESYGVGSLMQMGFSISAHEVHFGNNVFKNHWPGDAA